MKSGIAAKIAKPFINSKLTLLLMIAFLSVGIYSSFLIPREEEPQIEVPIKRNTIIFFMVCNYLYMNIYSFYRLNFFLLLRKGLQWKAFVFQI